MFTIGVLKEVEDEVDGLVWKGVKFMGRLHINSTGINLYVLRKLTAQEMINLLKSINGMSIQYSNLPVHIHYRRKDSSELMKKLNREIDELERKVLFDNISVR